MSTAALYACSKSPERQRFVPRERGPWIDAAGNRLRVKSHALKYEGVTLFIEAGRKTKGGYVLTELVPARWVRGKKARWIRGEACQGEIRYREGLLQSTTSGSADCELFRRSFRPKRLVDKEQSMKAEAPLETACTHLERCACVAALKVPALHSKVKKALSQHCGTAKSTLELGLRDHPSCEADLAKVRGLMQSIAMEPRRDCFGP